MTDRSDDDRPTIPPLHCELLGQHPTCRLAHDERGTVYPGAWDELLRAHEELSHAAHVARIQRRREERRSEVEQLSADEQERRLAEQSERIEAWIADVMRQGAEERAAEAAELGLSLEAWRLMLAMDDLDLRLFLAVHGVEWAADFKRCVPVLPEGVLTGLLEQAVEADPGLVEALERARRQPARTAPLSGGPDVAPRPG